MMEYISTKDASIKWGISQRRVEVLCTEKRIPNITMVGGTWLIPKIAEKPAKLKTGRKVVYYEQQRTT